MFSSTTKRPNIAKNPGTLRAEVSTDSSVLIMLYSLNEGYVLHLPTRPASELYYMGYEKSPPF